MLILHQYIIKEIVSINLFHNAIDLRIVILFTYQGVGSIKMTSYHFRKSHFGDKMIVRPFYLHNNISYTGKITSLYWITALNPWTCITHPRTATEQKWHKYHPAAPDLQMWWIFHVGSCPSCYTRQRLLRRGVVSTKLLTHFIVIIRQNLPNWIFSKKD